MKTILLSFSFCFLLACHSKQEMPVMNEEEAKEHMMNVNRILVEKESAAIHDFIRHHGWDMQQTGTGLYYQVYKEGSGAKPQPNEVAVVAYKLYLLDGTFCYEVDSLKPLVFVPGKGQQPRGLEEGLGMMREGDKARLVLPSHLAFSTAGDGDKIPGNSSLYYDVTLLKIQHEKH